MDLEDMFPPNNEELRTNDEQLFAMWFMKPYDLRSATTFVRLQGFSIVYMIECETVYIFYQQKSYVPFRGDWLTFNNKLTDSEVLEGLTHYRLKHKKYFKRKIAYLTF